MPWVLSPPLSYSRGQPVETDRWILNILWWSPPLFYRRFGCVSRVSSLAWAWHILGSCHINGECALIWDCCYMTSMWSYPPSLSRWQYWMMGYAVEHGLTLLNVSWLTFLPSVFLLYAASNICRCWLASFVWGVEGHCWICAQALELSMHLWWMPVEKIVVHLTMLISISGWGALLNTTN